MAISVWCVDSFVEDDVDGLPVEIKHVTKISFIRDIDYDYDVEGTPAFCCLHCLF